MTESIESIKLRQFKETESIKSIKENYYKSRTIQSYDFVEYLHEKYLDFTNPSKTFQMTMLDALLQLNNFVDLSDPDMELPNIVHACQTAEKMRQDNLPDWMQLVGLIHDVGKILYLKGIDEDGTSMKNQFSIVGDTFIVGHKIPSTIVFEEFNSLNLDTINNVSKYTQGCGLNNCKVSFGHDEYLYQVLKYNRCKIPQEGLDMIRYHSMYVLHTEGEYKELLKDEDLVIIENLKLFNKYDLYTKTDKIIEFDEKYYIPIIKKYIGLNKLIW